MTRGWDEWVPWSRCIASTVNCRLLQWAVFFFSSSRNASTHEPKQRVNYRFICLLFANCTVKCLDIRSGLGYRKAVTLSKFSCIRLITSFCSFHLFRRKIRFWFGFYNILLHSTWRSFDQLNPSATLLHDYFTFALLVSFVLFLARRNWNPFEIMIKKLVKVVPLVL